MPKVFSSRLASALRGSPRLQRSVRSGVQGMHGLRAVRCVEGEHLELSAQWGAVWEGGACFGAPFVLRGAARTPNGEAVALVCVQRSAVPTLSRRVSGTSASCSVNVALPIFGAPPEPCRNLLKDARLKLRQFGIGSVYESMAMRTAIRVRGTSARCSLNAAVPISGAPPDTLRKDAGLKVRQLLIGLVYASRVIRNSSSARNEVVGEGEGGEERSGENASADARNVKMRTRWPCCISLLCRRFWKCNNRSTTRKLKTPRISKSHCSLP